MTTVPIRIQPPAEDISSVSAATQHTKKEGKKVETLTASASRCLFCAHSISTRMASNVD